MTLQDRTECYLDDLQTEIAYKDDVIAELKEEIESLRSLVAMYQADHSAGAQNAAGQCLCEACRRAA